MDLKTYQKKCTKTAKVGRNPDIEIMNWGLGVAGEAGDLAGCIKKTVNHDNDQTQGIRENIGDAMWYLAMICNFYGWDFEEILDENIEKLNKRYADGKFTFKHARRNNTRIDWNE
ncbi:MAG: nucleoside triphosphate pyrophosphohydrolase family protein [DPANN group archaeon]|nr:nucleoside triphosphate pyrophosphohydrolase family protein [DPANN group archaeon]